MATWLGFGTLAQVLGPNVSFITGANLKSNSSPPSVEQKPPVAAIEPFSNLQDLPEALRRALQMLNE